MLLAEHCPEDLKSKSGKMEIMIIPDLVLRVLLLAINKVVGSQVPHDTNNLNFQYAIDCTVPTIFNWVEDMKINIKCQLIKAKARNLKQIFFGYVLVTFFLERAPFFQYQLTKVDPPMP